MASVGTSDVTWDYLPPVLWSTVEICVGIICACLPVIGGLLPTRCRQYVVSRCRVVCPPGGAPRLIPPDLERNVKGFETDASTLVARSTYPLESLPSTETHMTIDTGTREETFTVDNEIREDAITMDNDMREETVVMGNNMQEEISNAYVKKREKPGRNDSSKQQRKYARFRDISQDRKNSLDGVPPTANHTSHY